MNQLFTTVLPVIIPTTLLFGGVIVGSSKINIIHRRTILRAISLIIIIMTALLTAGGLLNHSQYKEGLLDINGLKLTILLLVSFMAITLIRFSERYLHAEKNAHQYWRWLLLSLASVSLVILSNHLLLLWAGWVAISLCFHRLLLFYPDRPRAVLAAHKKFILARLAELLLLLAIMLLYWHHGTFYLSTITDFYLSSDPDIKLNFGESLAATLIALTALIKCAQLPVHGWLIQVVEAPTPVSALLHAGIINLGGYLLLSFSPLIAFSPIAQWLIIVVAGLSTLISALVMMTRISIKVRLAWSTCAQMGLMLIECALGLDELALLHLFSHSLYKAYAFLSAGEVLQDYSLKHLAQNKKITLSIAIYSFLLAVIATAGIAMLPSYQGPVSIWLLVNTAMAMYLISALRSGCIKNWLVSVLSVFLLVCFYIAGKALFGQIVPQLQTTGMLDAIDIFLCLMIVILFVLTVQISVFRDTRQTHTLYRWLFSGLYLDEIMTRMTLQVWPIVLRPNFTDITTRKESIKESQV
jgi:NAD(P)H-quinone oxidoreductase subunit 5